MEKVEASKIEWGADYDDCRFYEVLRPFMMRVNDGPLVAAKVGEIVFLSKRFGNEMLISGKAIPKDLSEHFEALRDFQIVVDGEYRRIEKGDILKMTPLEAIEHLRRGEIKEKKGEVK